MELVFGESQNLETCARKSKQKTKKDLCQEIFEIGLVNSCSLEYGINIFKSHGMEILLFPNSTKGDIMFEHEFDFLVSHFNIRDESQYSNNLFGEGRGK